MPKIRWDGDAASAAKAGDDLAEAIKGIGEQAEKATKNTKQLEAAAQRIKEAISPQEKYNRQLRDLAMHVKAGRLSLDEANKAAAMYRAQLQRTGETGQRAFSGIGSELTSLVTGFVSATGVVAAITEAFRQAEEAAQKTADSVFDALGAVGELQQLGPKGQAQALQISRDLIKTGAVRPDQRAQAVAIGTNMVNAELNNDEIDLLVRDLAATRIVAAENLDAVGGNLRGLMSQFSEESLREVARRTRGAANLTKADFATTAREVLKFGGLATKSGITLDEALAAYAASEETAASPENAAEMQKSFFSQVYRRQLGKGDLFATLENIQSKIPKGGNAFSVLGDANAVIGFEDLMRDLPRLRRELGQIQAGEAFTSSIEGLKADPVYYAAHLKAKTEGAESAALERRTSERELLLDALRADLNARGVDRGEWAITRWARNADLMAADLFGNEGRAFQAEITQSQLTGRRASPEVFEQIKDYVRRTAEGAEALKNQTRGRAAARPE